MNLHFAEFPGSTCACCPFRLSIVGKILPPALRRLAIYQQIKTDDVFGAVSGVNGGAQMRSAVIVHRCRVSAAQRFTTAFQFHGSAHQRPRSSTWETLSCTWETLMQPASADLRSARQCFLACTRQPTRDERLEPTRDERLALSLQLSGPLLAAARALPVAPLRYEASSASIQGLAVVRRCCAPLVGALVPVRGIIGDGLRHGHAPGSTAN